MLKGFKNSVDRDFSQPENQEAMKEAFARVDAEKGADYPLIIGGERIYTDEKIVSYSPSTKEALGTVSACSAELADKAIRNSYEAFQSWRLTPVEERITCIRRLAELLDRDRFYFDALMAEEVGKNWAEGDGEVSEMIDFCNSYAMHMRTIDQGIELVDSDEENQCVYVPIGVGVALSPWNFPLSLFGGMVVSAVITGNTIVCKPSSDAPITAYKFCEYCEAAGFPAGVINFIPGQGSVIGDTLTSHPLVRFINFTGSKAVGAHINELAAKATPDQKWIKRVVAEMGGKNAIIVDSSANLDLAAEGIATSAFSLQGQKCSACSRAIVMDDVYDELVDKVVAIAEEMRADQGPGRDNHIMGALVNQAAYDKVMGYIEIARGEGTIVCGGHGDDSQGYYVEPTVVRDVERTARIANEEIFGPVLAVIKVHSFEEALDVANDTEYGLTGSVYSSDRANIQLAKTHFHVGNLYFNHKSTGAVVLNHPFAGFDMSGTNAKTGTLNYLLNFLNLKSVCEVLTY